MAPLPHVSQTVTEEELVDLLTPVYKADRGKLLRAMTHVQHKNRSTYPLFPKVDVAAIPPIPEADQEAFLAKHVSDQYIKWNSPEGVARRVDNGRNLQFARWNWALANMGTYINVLRLKGYSDDRITQMMEGMPLCMESRENFDELCAALAELAPKVAAEMGWRDVAFVFTGSSVPGFSQNPLKGHASTPSRIVNAATSDVDICIVADGVNRTVARIAVDGSGVEPKRAYPTTVDEVSSGLRYGCWDLRPFCAAAADFHDVWNAKLPAGLQFTFSEDDTAIPPWEAFVDTGNVGA